MKNLFFFISLLFCLNISAQQKLTWLKLAPYKTAEFSDTLRENSGLAFFKNKLYTINDSGNSSEIFEIDRTSARIKTIWKTGLKNNDWEAIATDSTHFYVGDFGNNRGTRKHLMIHKIPFRDSLILDSIQTIPFFYPEQESFGSQNLNTDFDAEAMVVLNGKIHLFTKEWRSKGVAHYIIDPTLTENQPAKKAEYYKTDFVVTDASYFNGSLYVVGYTKQFEIYLAIFRETSPGIFFSQAPKKYYLGSTLGVGQIEGVAVDESGVYISGEEFWARFATSRARLYFIPMKKLENAK